MLEFKHILRFSVVVVILAALLFYPWTFVERTYARAFQAVNTKLFSRFWFWSAGQAAFIDLRAKDVFEQVDAATPGVLDKKFKPPPPTNVLDTLVIVVNHEPPGGVGQFRVTSRLLGYWPTAWLLILVLAKPLILRRKAWACFWGMLLLHAFLAFRVSIKLLEAGFADPSKKYALFRPGAWGADVLQRLHQVFVEDPTVSFIIPTLIWFLVAFTADDWAAVRQLAARGPDDSPDEG